MAGTIGQGTLIAPKYGPQRVSPGAERGTIELYSNDNLPFVAAWASTGNGVLGADYAFATVAGAAPIWDFREYRILMATLSVDSITGGTAPTIYHGFWQYDNNDQTNAKRLQGIATSGTAGAIPAGGGQYITQCGDVGTGAAGSGTSITTTLYSLQQRIPFGLPIILVTGSPTGWVNMRYFLWGMW